MSILIRWLSTVLSLTGLCHFRFIIHCKCVVLCLVNSPATQPRLSVLILTTYPVLISAHSLLLKLSTLGGKDGAHTTVVGNMFWQTNYIHTYMCQFWNSGWSPFIYVEMVSNFQICWYLPCCFVVHCVIHHGLLSTKASFLKCVSLENFDQWWYTSVSGSPQWQNMQLYVRLVLGYWCLSIGRDPM